MAKVSISVVKGKGSVNHNNREFITENVNKDRTADNITYKRESLEDAYEHCFGQAIKDYNAKQKRADRRIDGAKGYMEQIRNSKNGEKLFYENVVQVGNMFDSHVGTEQGETCKNVLDDYMRDFQRRNPNLYVFNAVMHLDEQTPHLHIDYIPLARGYQKGLQVRNSLDRAFKEQGIEGKSNKYENRTIAWQNAEKDHIEEVMRGYGLKRAEEKGIKQEHLTVDQYKAVSKRIRNEVKKMPKQIDSAPTLTSRERVTVSKDDLAQLEKRARLSLVHEKATREIEKNIQESMKSAYTSAITRRMQADKLYQDAKDDREQAQEELEEVRRTKSEVKDLRNRYEQRLEAIEKTDLKKENSILKAELEQVRNEASALKAENRSLKAQIEDLRKGFEEKLEQATNGLKTRIDSLDTHVRTLGTALRDSMQGVNFIKSKYENKDLQNTCVAIHKHAKETLQSVYVNTTRMGLDEEILPDSIKKHIRPEFPDKVRYIKNGQSEFAFWGNDGKCYGGKEILPELRAQGVKILDPHEKLALRGR